MNINKKKFTPEQIKAINAEGDLIVVSANAGSGKTSVLVERIVNKLLSKHKLKDFLIVTFTNAAADEMKERIKNRILEESAKNVSILSELENLDSAFICTIDSFCMYVVRKNISQIGTFGNSKQEFFPAMLGKKTMGNPYNISNPDFKIADEKDIETIRFEAINLIFEEIYKNNDPELIKFINNFSGEVNEDKIIKFIHKWLDFSANIADINEYIGNSIKNFEIPFEDTKIYKFLIQYIKNQIEFIIDLLKQAIKICELNDELKEKYISTFETNCLNLKNILKDCDLFDIIQKIKKFNFEKLRPAKQCEEKEKIKKILDKCKKIINNFKEISLNNNFELKNTAKIFLYICKQIDKKIYEIKLKKNIFEFSDIEKIAYQILKNKKLEINFKEIIIDEFQDINDIQNKIFDLIAKKMFIVGDYKQSIYGFRGAEPEIFELKKRKVGCKNINLTKNFRSRKEILDFINNYFEKHMTKYISEIEYNKNEKLICGANFIDKDSNCIEIVKNIYNNNENKEEKECDFICNKIKLMISDNFKINKNGEKVDIKLSDFCIMCRNFSKYSKILFDKFKINNIKFKTNDASDFLNSQETKFLIAMLRVLDNRYSEIALTEVILNDFFGFEICEILTIKQKYNNLNLYNSIKKYSETSDFLSQKCIHLIKYLNNLNKNNLYKIIIDLIYDLENKFGRNVYYDKFLQMTNEFIKNNNVINIENLIDYILNNKNFDVLNNFNHEDAVLITSVHKAKGKEFPVCFLLDSSSKNIDN
ncbi:MAG: UvrD-helicase domain-containing protein, partial [Clostridia bacterium]|nr:UvrD-helicase domain-containing protein [Clostridia bacterium]